MRFKFLALVFLVILSSCGSSSEVTANLPKIKKSKLVKYNTAKSFNKSDIKTAKIKAKMSYEIGDSAHKLGLNLRIQKGQKIWMSADFFGIPMAKLLVEKNRVRYYNKIDKSYFEGSFDFLNQISGIEVDYNTIEAMLTGDSMVDLKDRVFKLFKGYGFYYLRNVSFGYYLKTIEVYPENFKLKQQSFLTDDNKNVFRTFYKKYKDFNGFLFPIDVEIHAKNKEKTSVISMTYSSVKFNQELKFPYQVPRDCTNRVILDRKKKK